MNENDLVTTSTRHAECFELMNFNFIRRMISF